MNRETTSGADVAAISNPLGSVINGRLAPIAKATDGAVGRGVNDDILLYVQKSLQDAWRTSPWSEDLQCEVKTFIVHATNGR